MDSSQIDYVDSNSILVINPAGRIRQLYVPFRVQVLQNTSTLRKNTWVFVEEVRPHPAHKMLYRITKAWWQYDLFRLQVNF